MRRSMIVLAAAASSLGFAACVGSIGDSRDGVGQTESGLCAVDTPIRRLTRFEYNNTVRDLLGDTTRPASGFPPEETGGTFDNQADALKVTELLAEQYMKAAEGISERAIQNLDTLIPYCSEAADGAQACGAEFITTFGKRAFRRPLTDDEVARFQALFDWALDDPDLGTFADGIQLVIQAMLQSPHFLYRPEFGSGEPIELDVVRLTSWEMASRLSYTLWNSMPDDELMRAAEAGELTSPENIEQQARRMLEDERAKDAIRHFHHQWLMLHELDTITKDANLFPNYHDGLRDLWKQELERFVEHAVLEDDGSLQTLLTASYSFMNAELAAFYGIDPASAPAGSELEKVSLDPTQRAGFLTMGALMATHAKADQTSPVHRGKFVREQLMCQMLPLPPNNLVIEPPKLDSTKTTREQFEEIGADPDCSFCHNLMNPIGFGFENYDAVGVWRDTQNGKPIDATGEIVAGNGLEGTFDGAVELAGMLAGSDQVASCVASQWFRFGYGRPVEPGDSCTTEMLNEVFRASGYNIKELLVALTQTDAFLYRHQVVAEGGAP